MLLIFSFIFSFSESAFTKNFKRTNSPEFQSRALKNTSCHLSAQDYAEDNVKKRTFSQNF